MDRNEKIDWNKDEKMIQQPLPESQTVGDFVEEKKIQISGRTCWCCGHTGPEVSLHMVYIGGQGNVWRPECDNRPECWVRQGWGKVCLFDGATYCGMGKLCEKCEIFQEAKG